MKKQFSRNIPSLSREEQAQLADRHVLVAGCGGLGSFVVEYLARLGVGKLTVVDAASLTESDMNRQLFSTCDNLGKSKVFAAEARVKAVNPDVTFRPWPARLDAASMVTAVHGKDLVIDALDNIDDRMLLADACDQEEVPLIHGSVVGWRAQVMVVPPGSSSLYRFYKNNVPVQSRSTLPITEAFCASIQVAEALKLLCGKPSALRNKVLAMDLKTLEQRICAPTEVLFPPRTFRITVCPLGAGPQEREVSENQTVRDVLGETLDVEGVYILYNNTPLHKSNADSVYLDEGDILIVRKGRSVSRKRRQSD